MSYFYSQIWAIEPSNLLKMESVVERKFLGMSRENLEQFSNTEKNKPYRSGWIDQDGEAKKVAVIPITGPMFKKAGILESLSGASGTGLVVEAIKQANADEEIEAILLDIDSPGGAVDGTQTLANTVRDSNKTVIAFINGMAASAAYWVASQADQLIASEETSLVGSIGTLYTHKASQWVNEKGETITQVVSDGSEDKIKPSAYKPLDEDEVEAIKAIINPINEAFLNAIRNSRNVEEEALTGKVYPAKKAINLGLIDSIGTIQTALEIAVNYKKDKDMENNLKTELEAVQSENAALKAELEALKATNDSELIGTIEEEKEEAIRAATEAEAKVEALNEQLNAYSQLEQKVAALEAKLEEADDEPTVTEINADLHQAGQADPKPWLNTPWNKKAAEMAEKFSK